MVTNLCDLAGARRPVSRRNRLCQPPPGGRFRVCGGGDRASDEALGNASGTSPRRQVKLRGGDVAGR